MMSSTKKFKQILLMCTKNEFIGNKVNGEAYVADSLEIYLIDDFQLSVKLHGWTDEGTEQHQANFRKFAIEETAGLLMAYFGTSLGQQTH